MKKIDDQFRYWLTGIVVFCFVLSLPLVAWANLDLGVGATARSYPLSGVAEARAGYGMLLYGAAGTPLSGYLRPNIEVNSAGTYNSGMAQLEFFPLAFFGARAGGESIQNDKDYTPYKCDVARCKGRFHRTFFGADLSLGVGPVFAVGRWRRERWSQPKEQLGDFIEPTSGLLMRGTGESQTIVYGLVGYKMSDMWTSIAGVRYGESDSGVSRMPFAMLRFTKNDFAVGLGAGQFESTLKEKGFTTWGYVAWDFMPSAVTLK